MGNIYDGCVDNKKLIYASNINEMDKLLKQEIKNNAGKYTCVFVDGSYGLLYGTRVVLYDKDVPLIMQNCKHRWVWKNNKLIRLGLVGICDCCKKEDELICLCDLGNICEKCMKKHKVGLFNE